ncbi:flagellar protein FlbA [Borrelia miyamotoi]|uniref:Flagellar protein FlbA n=1 Tax=Borrelia miyamotoi TaxID=47466 RepID=A0AAX3JMZ5_9SPIR|nr:flagellar protein FlbA [Borrelia miyamotoi]QFP42032.1 flagellar protein FlbA [Borrelia miyamotoi]QFP48148.1 flagellar protein FlbA [Borrelia miyamotoi]QGT55908.1 flagellar protein FlbA [Borrelia miyamotoi]QGT56687.1 flagellar protein FlbA [Borrelia miyamotoi]WAZ71948.1 flagellar protein FlbA [Borrelia miyamotoi]
MSDLNFKIKKFEKILNIRVYDRKLSENDLMNINSKISEIEEFLEGISKDLNRLNGIDIFLKGNYLDYLTSKKKEELKKLVKFRYEYDKYHDIYLKKYGAEKKVSMLIESLNSTIIKEKIKSENLVLDEYVNYKICNELGNINE